MGCQLKYCIIESNNLFSATMVMSQGVHLKFLVFKIGFQIRRQNFPIRIPPPVDGLFNIAYDQIVMTISQGIIN